jgi:hypothetical protein
LYKIGTAPEKIAYNLLKQKVWLPGMGSNHEVDKILKSRKLLILQMGRSRQKHQKQASGTKSVQKFLAPNLARIWLQSFCGRTLVGFVPALSTVKRSPASCRSRPSAICDRAELPDTNEH